MLHLVVGATNPLVVGVTDVSGDPGPWAPVPGRARRVRSRAALDALRAQFSYPSPGLQEVIVIKAGEVLRLFP